jgi:hypothetical protein
MLCFTKREPDGHSDAQSMRYSIMGEEIQLAAPIANDVRFVL